MTGLLSRERIIAAPGYNRWCVPLASVAIHLCIGSVYAWSIYNPPLTRVFGVVASAAFLKALRSQQSILASRRASLAEREGILRPLSRDRRRHVDQK